LIQVLTRRGTVYRKVQASQTQLGATDVIVYPFIAFEVVPVSDLDRVVPYALEATHILWVPRWASLHKEDVVVYASYANTFGARAPFRFVVNSRHQNVRGLPNTGYYCTERE